MHYSFNKGNSAIIFPKDFREGKVLLWAVELLLPDVTVKNSTVCICLSLQRFIEKFTIVDYCPGH